MYFVDYPLGYRRGPDALDMWLDVSWKKGIHKANLELGYLRQGIKISTQIMKRRFKPVMVFRAWLNLNILPI